MEEQSTQVDEHLGAGDTIAFPILSPAEINVLRKYGEEREMPDKAPLWSPGDRDYCFFVILSGGCCVRDSPESEELIAFHGPGAFSGDVDIMTGRPAPVGGYADTVPGSATLRPPSGIAAVASAPCEAAEGGDEKQAIGCGNIVTKNAQINMESLIVDRMVQQLHLLECYGVRALYAG